MSANSVANPYIEIEDKEYLEVLTPSLKGREYAKLRLENGVEVYIVSDPEATQSAASLSVEAGSWEDPDDHLGLAHFLEHMLFLGTSKYPEEGAYGRFIKEHGGHTNAYTTSDHTAYMFSVQNEFFEGGLDRFSWFFKDPLFNPSGVKREKNAVDQEFQQNKEQDSRRIHQVRKKLSSPNHPDYRFSSGNLQTLGKTDRATLVKWYEQHYSSEKMHLVIYASQSLTQLKKWAVENFSGVPKRSVEKKEIKGPFFDEKFKGMLTYAEPLKEMRELTLYWEIPNGIDRFSIIDSGKLLGYVLGHEGEESLLAQLKREHLAQGLSAGFTYLGKKTPLFVINISLTRQGTKEYLKVLERCYQTISLLNSQGVPRYIFDEMQQMSKWGYQYQSREEVFSTVMQHASAILEEPLESYPLQVELPHHYAPELLSSFIKFFTPQNAVTVFVAPKNEAMIVTDQKEEYMQVNYTSFALSDPQMQRLATLNPHPEIQLPKENPFIPQKIEQVVGERSESAYPVPQLLLDDEKGKIYYAQDSSYLVPEVVLQFHLKLPVFSYGGAYERVLGELYLKSVSEQLNTISYSASLAGLDYTLGLSREGIALVVNGYENKLPVLLDKIIQVMKQGMPTRAQFDIYHQLLEDQYANFELEIPAYIALEHLKSTIHADFISNGQKHKAIQDVDYLALEEFQRELFKEVYFEGIAYGSLSQKNARKYVDFLQKQLGTHPYLKENHKQARVVLFPDQQSYALKKKAKQQGNCSLLCIQGGEFSHRQRGVLELASDAMKKPFYQELRTEQQTGYIVWNDVQHIEDQLYNYFGVQSATHDPRELLARFELFIERFIGELGGEKFPKERFESLKEGLLSRLVHPPDNLLEMASVLYSIAFVRKAKFDWIEKRIEALKALDFDAFIAELKNIFGKENKQRFALLVYGGQMPEHKIVSYQSIQDKQQVIAESKYVSRKNHK